MTSVDQNATRAEIGRLKDLYNLRVLRYASMSHFAPNTEGIIDYLRDKTDRSASSKNRGGEREKDRLKGRHGEIREERCQRDCKLQIS